jgi:hypothetical protein
MGKNTLIRNRKRFSRDPEEGGGGGGQTGESGQEGGKKGGEPGKEGEKKPFVPPSSQEEFDRIITDRVTRERNKYQDYDTYKASHEKWLALERESQTDVERREREIREEALQEAMAKAVPAAVRQAFRAEAKGVLTDEQVKSLLEDLDLSKYANEDGEIDEEKVAKKVAAFAPAKGGSGKNGSGPGFGQGNGHSATKTRPGEAGVAEAERRFGKQKANA